MSREEEKEDNFTREKQKKKALRAGVLSPSVHLNIEKTRTVTLATKLWWIAELNTSSSCSTSSFSIPNDSCFH
jgi:hypothetical protein